MASYNVQQRTPAWHAARKGKLTASNLGAALGLVQWRSRQQAFNAAMGVDKFVGAAFNDAIGHVPISKLPIRPLFYAGNDATRWGTKNESNGILAYSAHTGNLVSATGLHVHPATSWLAGSPDGLVGTEGLIEVKCPYYRKKDGSQIHTEIPPYYYLQMNLCMEATERKWCDYVCWTPEAYAIYRVTRDEELHEALMSHYLRFFSAMQRMAKSPPVQTREEKEQIRELVTESMRTHIDYDFWRNADPNDQPPDLDDEDLESSPKRPRFSGEEEGECSRTAEVNNCAKASDATP